MMLNRQVPLSYSHARQLAHPSLKTVVLISRKLQQIGLNINAIFR